MARGFPLFVGGDIDLVALAVLARVKIRPFGFVLFFDAARSRGSVDDAPRRHGFSPIIAIAAAKGWPASSQSSAALARLKAITVKGAERARARASSP